MRTTDKKSLRGEVLKYAKRQYGTGPEYLWRSAPDYCVLRHGDNRRWYAIIMDLPKSRLGLPGDEIVDVLDLKADPVLSVSLRDGKSIFPGYHMQKGSWITVLLDGSVEKRQICWLLDRSFENTCSHQKVRRGAAANPN
jgi:predicted DNA-binding protein (MmcQ/YjbR family)